MEATLKDLPRRKEHEGLKYLIAIDPDLSKSGLAVWNMEQYRWGLTQSIPFADLADTVKEFPKEETLIYVEAGWMNKKSNWRGYGNRVNERIAKSVGQNHATGQLLVQILKKAGFEVKEIEPLAKGVLKGRKGWTPTGRRYITEASGIEGRMNDDVRDAVYILLRYR